MNNAKTYTAAEVQKKMEHYCAYQERCHKEVKQKLWEMRLAPAEKEQIIVHLIEHDFLNESRFAQSFTRGKFRIKKWGRERIVRELKQREISEYNIRLALKEIDPDEYLNTLDELAELRLSQITEKNKYKKRKKMADYLLYRGWESELVYEKTVELIP